MYVNIFDGFWWKSKVNSTIKGNLTARREILSTEIDNKHNYKTEKNKKLMRKYSLYLIKICRIQWKIQPRTILTTSQDLSLLFPNRFVPALPPTAHFTLKPHEIQKSTPRSLQSNHLTRHQTPRPLDLPHLPSQRHFHALRNASV